MKTLVHTFILLNVLSYSTSSTFNYPLIDDYLQRHNIKVSLFLTCEPPGWKVDDNLKTNNYWMNHWDMSSEDNLSNFNYEDFFVRFSHPICVIVNLECNETKSMLNEISKRTMFHFERYWLLFGESDENVFDLLSGENINVDAEVAIVIPKGEK